MSLHVKHMTQVFTPLKQTKENSKLSRSSMHKVQETGAQWKMAGA
jgi:hypothetical protein